jgi:Condensation domain
VSHRLAPGQTGIAEYRLTSARSGGTRYFDAYALDVHFEIHGALDVDLLRSAVSLAAGSHQALTAFETGANGIWSTGRAPSFTSQVLEQAGTDEARSAALSAAAGFVDSFLKDDSKTFAVLLQQTAPRAYVLTIVIDHFWADGMSTQTVLDSISLAYSGHTAAPGAEKDDGRGDLVTWIEDQWSDVDQYLEQEVTFWDRLLGRDSEQVATQFTHRGESAAEHPSVRVDRLSDTELATLQRDAAAAGVTLFAHLLARYATYHQRVTKGGRLVVKTSLSGRLKRQDLTVVAPAVRDVYLPLADLVTSSELETNRNVQNRIAEALAHSRVPDFFLWKHLWPGDYAHMSIPPFYFSLRSINRRLELDGVIVDDLLVPLQDVWEGVDWGIDIEDRGALSTYSSHGRHTAGQIEHSISALLGLRPPACLGSQRAEPFRPLPAQS